MSTRGDAPMKLYTFTISHFSEKVRWTLDAAGLDYTEIPLVPGLHMARALWLSRRATTVPILEADGECVQGSGLILRWLAEHRAPMTLLPRTTKALADALAIEARYEAVGAAVFTLVYERLVEEPALLLKLWSLDAGPLEAAALRRVLPALSLGFQRRFRLTRRSGLRAQDALASALDELDIALGDGRRYLVGKRLSIADVSVGALLAPVVAPDEHPVYGSAVCRALMPPVVQGWHDRPAFAWVRRLYHDHRGVPKPGSAFANARAALGG